MNINCGIMLGAQTEDNLYLVSSLKRDSFLEFLNHRLYSRACSPCLVPLVFAFHLSL